MMAELFEAVGFEITDEDSYNLLVEDVEFNGQRSRAERQNAARRHGQKPKLIGCRVSPVFDRLRVNARQPGSREARGDGSQILLRSARLSNHIRVNRRQIAGDHETHPGKGANVIEVFPKTTERAIRFFGGSLWRGLPLFPRRVRAAAKVHPVPEFPVHPLAGMVVDADQPAAIFLDQTLGDG